MRRAIRLVTSVFAGATVMTCVPAVAQAQTKFPYTYHDPGGGTTIIPSLPKRVVTIGAPDLDALLSLGVKPVGIASADTSTSSQISIYQAGGGLGEPELNGDELKGIANVGEYETPDYEYIASLKPDLIIVEVGLSSAEEQQAATIAPTIEVDDTPPVGSPPLVDQYFWANAMRNEVGPIFDGVKRAQEVIARLEQRETAMAGFARGTTVAQVIPGPGDIYSLVNSDQDMGGVLQLAGMKLEASVKGGTPNGSDFTNFSDEALPDLTAQKVLFVGVAGSLYPPSQAQVEADPLYPAIPAVGTHQSYFTGWFAVGPVGDADALEQLSQQMFGVTGLEAALTGTGKHKASRSGIADVDVSPTADRVCWAISTAGSSVHPSSVVVENAKGTVKLFSLGKGYHTTGCANIKGSAARKLLSSRDYQVAIERSGTALLRGAIGKQLPKFFGYDRTDKLVTIKPTGYTQPVPQTL